MKVKRLSDATFSHQHGGNVRNQPWSLTSTDISTFLITKQLRFVVRKVYPSPSCSPPRGRQHPCLLQCVERMLSEVNVEIVWPKIADSWDKPGEDNTIIVENFLLNKRLMSEIQVEDTISVSRRKM